MMVSSGMLLAGLAGCTEPCALCTLVHPCSFMLNLRLCALVPSIPLQATARQDATLALMKDLPPLLRKLQTDPAQARAFAGVCRWSALLARADACSCACACTRGPLSPPRCSSGSRLPALPPTLAGGRPGGPGPRDEAGGLLPEAAGKELCGAGGLGQGCVPQARGCSGVGVASGACV